MARKKILLVDEVELFLRLEKTFMHRDEFDLVVAQSGQEVLRIVEEERPDLIFLDLYLPGIDGDECCRFLKWNERYRDIPVIMVALSGREDDLEQCREAGCDDVVLKPINRRDLLEVVQKHLQVRKRTSPRYTVRMPVYYGTDSPQLLADAINLSTGGLFLETDHLLAAGTPLTVRFVLPGREQMIECQARVVWINDPESLKRPDLPPGMGLQVSDLSIEGADAIQRGGFAPEESYLPIEPGATESEPMKILIADDSAERKQQLRGILERERYAILEAGSCSEALRAIREQPGLVIVNAALNGNRGYELCAELKRALQTANVPLLILSGWTLSVGNICGLSLGAIDHITRPIDESDILARVKNCLSIHRMSESFIRTRRQLLAQEQEMEESLHAAAVIQRSFLPLSVPKGTSFDFAWRFLPCQQVGGDLFNVFKLDEFHLGAYVIDVCGHGVPAAMITTSVAQALDPMSGSFLKMFTSSRPYYELVSPAEVLTRLNQEYPFERFEKYFTICYLLLDVKNGTVRYSNAGHPYPLLIGSAGRVERLRKGGTIIGMGAGSVYEEEEISLEIGDRLFLFTDGIAEYQNAGGEFYGEERFIRELQAGSGQKLQAACARIIYALKSFGGGLRPGDDITLLGIEYRPPSQP